MNSFKRDKKKDDEGTNPFQDLDKTTVLQGARIFNDTSVNPRRCGHMLTKILYLINQGEQLSTAEATEIFFAMTKLFQSEDIHLRRLVYLGIKELSGIANDVIIVTSSLTKDMTGKECLYHAPAIRALCTVIDGGSVPTIERYMKQAIVDRNSHASSAALVSALHLNMKSSDIAKRWSNEAQEAIYSGTCMVQYHALGVLYQSRKGDNHALIKMVLKMGSCCTMSPYALCLLIQITYKLLGEADKDKVKELLEFLMSCMKHKSDMVTYEAARVLLNYPYSRTKHLAYAMALMQRFSTSPKTTLRFAAVRTLNKVAILCPEAVLACKPDLEGLITDPNRSIATLAITTLLKIGSEHHVEQLMKQIATFMSEISDEFKIMVVEAIRALCQKFPGKHGVLMSFLSPMLRDHGGLEYKTAIVDTIIAIMEINSKAKEAGLTRLCEFIEDCEYTSLAVRILHLLGHEGPTSKHPSRYIRIIYNRVILESPSVRAASVTALAHFATACPALLPNVLVLLSRCQLDSDDEVRDRATYYCSILQQNDPTIASFIEPLQVSIYDLQLSLYNYNVSKPHADFDISEVRLADKFDEPSPKIHLTESQQPRLTKEEIFMEKMSQIPQLKEVIRDSVIVKSSVVTKLTESETEYNVKCVRHVFSEYVVLQFDCVNTLPDQLLENVRVVIEPQQDYTVVCDVPCDRLAYNEPGTTYTVLKFPKAITDCSVTFPTTLHFIARDCDPTTGIPDTEQGYRDEYVLDDLDITLVDQLRGPTNRITNFDETWDTVDLKGYTTAEDHIIAGHSVRTLQEAISNIVTYIGLVQVDPTQKISPGTKECRVAFAGEFRGGIQVLARANLELVNREVSMKFAVRSPDPDLSHFILACASY